jgi:hypothetical protein
MMDEWFGLLPKPGIARKLIGGTLSWTSPFFDESAGDLGSEAVLLKCSDNKSDSHDASCGMVTSHIGPQGNASFRSTFLDFRIYKV